MGQVLNSPQFRSKEGAANGGLSQGQDLEWEVWGWEELPNITKTQFGVQSTDWGVSSLFLPV